MTEASSRAGDALEIVQLEVGLLHNFCEVIGCPRTGEAALVDPAFEVDRLLAEARRRDWRVTTIFLTHTHDDHVAGLDEAAALTGAVVRCHPLEVATAKRLAPRVEAVADGEEIRLGSGRVRAIFAPGHTPGCVCWFVPEPAALVTGDVLFVGSCGRASDVEAMVDTLQRKLGALPEETRVFPGHDYGKTPTSTLGYEFATNPALRAETPAAFRRWMQGRGR
ncbi:Glyoxylase, beta-lactamase superfamily II [Nannocystis exedens]|uniref:Glyoxylase, beta-lactamase superfamily II n=1 Tax=Nannocystis exedens TaxID=54 RepID=A0A1I2C3F0_9BACT|nr:MBL fold metallo-hydrolase [Nannocystis exedens]PCC71080.1 hydroxyacylglutathione hydrolase [Nannocystis exedens]SFE62956.1 Glyoxylase, beta-lactamase superfamily II [Nannocystis exedens]